MLENTNQCLHAKTGEDDGNPAKGSKKNGLAAGFDQSNEIGFETDGAHGHDDKEFGELLKRGKDTTGHTERGKESC